MLRLSSNTPEWLAVDISSSQLNKLERNEIDLRNIFLKPENGFVYRVFGFSDPLETEITTPAQFNRGHAFF